MTVGELIAELSHRASGQALAISSVDELFVTKTEAKLREHPGSVPSKRRQIITEAVAPLPYKDPSDPPLSPLQLDLHPRYIQLSVPADPHETSLWDALRMLREAVSARGYNNRPVEFADCVLVASTRWTQVANELTAKFPGLQKQLVNPMVLKTEAAWALMCGYDSVISLCTW